MIARDSNQILRKDDPDNCSPQRSSYSPSDQISPVEAPNIVEQRRAIPDALLEFPTHRVLEFNKKGVCAVNIVGHLVKRQQ